ncbi:MAG: plastocyanin/azurin family copper-binding protein [Actinomycetota bacterium]
MGIRSRIAIVMAAVLLVAGACGDDGGETVAGPPPEQSETPTGAAETADDDHDASMPDDSSPPAGPVDFGESADPGDADRVVDVVMHDDFTFEPDTIEVTDGEVVTFRIVNEGVIPHDFTIGDEATQVAHDTEMAAAGEAAPDHHDDEGAAPHDHGDEADGEEGHTDANALALDGGETGEMTWRFSDPGVEVLFGCHIPGHYAAGMVGDIVFS